MDHMIADVVGLLSCSFSSAAVATMALAVDSVVAVTMMTAAAIGLSGF